MQKYLKTLFCNNCQAILTTFSKFHCGFRKDFVIYYCLIEKQKKTVDNKKGFSALRTDLSKAFDRISHNFLMTELNAHGLSFAALQLMQVYIQNCKQRTKVGLTIDKKLKFAKHVEDICQKASRKLNALARLVNCMNLPERCIKNNL